MIKNFAKIANGVVINVAVAEDVWPFGDDPHVECPDGFGVGDLYDGVNFSKAPISPPTPEQIVAAQTKADAQAAKADAKLTALAAMTPGQVRAWVAVNVTNLADAKDALATLAVAVSILARKL